MFSLVNYPGLSCWIFILILSFVPFFASAQSSQILYSGLKNATSLYALEDVIYIVEQGRNRLLKLDKDGKFLESIGGKGRGDYEFDTPVDVHATNGLKIYISDYRNNRVQIFDRRGQYLSSLKAPSDFNNKMYKPALIVVNDLGEVFFVDENTRSVQHYDLDGNRMDAFTIPNQISKIDDLQLANRQFYILDKEEGLIHILNESGMYQRFYEAEDVQAFFVEGKNILLVYKDHFVMDDGSPTPKEVHFEKNLQPVDVQVRDEEIFILDKKSLLKWTLK